MYIESATNSKAARKTLTEEALAKHDAKALYVAYQLSKQLCTREDSDAMFRELKAACPDVTGWYGKSAYEAFGAVTVGVAKDKPAKDKPAKDKPAKAAKAKAPAKAAKPAPAPEAPAPVKLPKGVYEVPAGFVMPLADGTHATHYTVRNGVVVPLRLA
jgi:hypothetical protein